MKFSLVRFAGCLVALSAGVIGVAQAGPADCEAVYGALAKSLQMPNRQHVDQSIAAEGGRIKKIEQVSDGKKLYVKLRDEWRLSGMPIKGIIQDQEESRRNSKDEACSFLHDEELDGEAAALYGTRATLEVGRTSGRYWISKASGLVLKSETEMDVGGKNGRTTRAVRYEYKDVVVPKTKKKLH